MISIELLANFYTYPISETARSITILPFDDSPEANRKIARGFFVEGDPRTIAAGLETQLLHASLDEVKDRLLLPGNFNDLLLLVAVDHPLLGKLGLAEVIEPATGGIEKRLKEIREERPLRKALYTGAEVMLMVIRREFAQRWIDFSFDAREMSWLQSSIETLQQFQTRVLKRSFKYVSSIQAGE